MSEFTLDHGTQDGNDWYKSLDAFTQGYVEAMFFTECNSDQPELNGTAVSDLSEAARYTIIDDCTDFQNLETFEQLRADMPANYNEHRAGNDFWYTRNGHGTGFWDRGLGDPHTYTMGERLSADAKRFGTCDLYRGDDGKIYFVKLPTYKLS